MMGDSMIRPERMRGMFKIGDFSRLSNTSIRMLRYYDEIDLLKPILIDPITGYRYYSAQQLDVVNQVSKLKELGFSLSSIREIMGGRSDLDFLKKYLGVRLDELNEESKRVKRQISLLGNISDFLNNGEHFMRYSVSLKTFPQKDVIALRRTVSSQNDVGLLWVELDEEMKRQKCKLSEECLSLAIYYDNEYKETDIDVEIQTTVREIGEDNHLVRFVSAPERKVVSVTFRGNYDQRPIAIRAIADWLESSEYKMDGPMISIFHVTPYETPDENEWITEICYAVKQACS